LAKYLGEGTSRKKAEEKSSAFLFLLKALDFPALAFLQRLTKSGRTPSDRPAKNCHFLLCQPLPEDCYPELM